MYIRNDFQKILHEQESKSPVDGGVTETLKAIRNSVRLGHHFIDPCKKYKNICILKMSEGTNISYPTVCRFL